MQVPHQSFIKTELSHNIGQEFWLQVSKQHLEWRLLEQIFLRNLYKLVVMNAPKNLLKDYLLQITELKANFEDTTLSHALNS